MMHKVEIHQEDINKLLRFFGGISQVEDEFDIRFRDKDGNWDHKCYLADLTQFKKINEDKVYQECWLKFTYNDDHATNGKPQFMNKRIVQGKYKWTT